MSLVSVLLGFLISSICAFIFHLIKGGSVGRLVLFLFSAWVSFFTGQLVSNLLDWKLLRFGAINLFPALLATLIGLLAASFLAGPEHPRAKGSRRHSRR
jgi:ABC-type sugar transport system permease subunit